MLTKKNTGEQISKAGLDWPVPYLFISLAPPTLIQSDDASIRRRIVVNECGAYWRAALFNIKFFCSPVRRLIEGGA